MITVPSLGRKSQQIPFALGQGNAFIELQIPELTDEFTSIAGFDLLADERGGCCPFVCPKGYCMQALDRSGFFPSPAWLVGHMFGWNSAG